MAIEFLYDLYNKPFLLIYKPNGRISRVIATISEEEFDAKLKALQEFIESANSGRYFKPRYIKIAEFDIPESGFGYSFDNPSYCYSLFGAALRVIEDRFSSEHLKTLHDYHYPQQEQDVSK